MNTKEKMQDEVQLEQTAMTLVGQAKEITVNSPETLRAANEFLIQCSDIIKRIKHYWTGTQDKPGPKTLANRAWKSLCDREAEMLAIPSKARGEVENSIRDYRNEERRRAEAEQRKADEETRRREEAQRARELKKAERALDKGDDAKAEAHLAAAEEVFVPPTVVTPSVSSTERTDVGAVTGIMDLKIEVTSIKDVAKAVAEGKLPEHVLEIRLGATKTWAKGNGVRNLKAYGLLITEVERYQSRSTAGK